MIDVKDITKAYNGVPAIEHISCVFERGSIYGLVGYNGAGKTTLLKTVCGVLKPEQGTVTLDGQPVYDNPTVKSRLFLVSDDPYILPQASMRRMARFYKGYYPNWNDSLFNKLTRIFKLDTAKRIASFSKGMQRQAFIIFALSASPSFLLLDEAFDGIDPMMRDLVRQLLLESIAEREMGIVISSHNLRELEDLCDRVGVINGRHIVYDMCVDEMRVNMNKYKAVFAEDTDAAALLDALVVKYRNLVRDGKYVSFTAHGDMDDIKAQLAAHGALYVEALPLTLEEIFLIEMEAETYDFTGLFA